MPYIKQALWTVFVTLAVYRPVSAPWQACLHFSYRHANCLLYFRRGGGTWSGHDMCLHDWTAKSCQMNTASVSSRNGWEHFKLTTGWNSSHNEGQDGIWGTSTTAMWLIETNANVHSIICCTNYRCSGLNCFAKDCYYHSEVTCVSHVPKRCIQKTGSFCFRVLAK